MTRYLCNKCGEEIRDVFHECGKKHKQMISEVHSGAGWGSPGFTAKTSNE